MKITKAHLLDWLKQANEKIQKEKLALTELDQAIGDGDHGINLARGFQEVQQKIAEFAPDDTIDMGKICQQVGMVLLAKVGGASGPLLATAFLKMAKPLQQQQEVDFSQWVAALKEAVTGIRMRGKATTGEKTMLDVWDPVVVFLEQQNGEISAEAFVQMVKEQVEATREMVATKGRASYLGDRSKGHLDPGAVSSSYLFETMAQTMMESPQKYVGLVLVSHSEKVAIGVQEILRQLHPDVPVIPAGGTDDGGVGTSAIKIQQAIKQADTGKGVLVLFDLGSARLNTDMAIEMLDTNQQVMIADSPFIEGAYLGMVESSIGKSLKEVHQAAEKALLMFQKES